MPQLKLAFVLRIWEEPHPMTADDFDLRGSLHRVDTGQIRYFTDLKQIEAILQQTIQRQRTQGEREAQSD